MKILLDLQGCQSVGSRNRGIGRYSLALAEAMMSQRRGHEFHLLLNGAFPESIESLRATLRDLLPTERITVFHPCPGSGEGDTFNPWRTHASEIIRRYAIRCVRPDVLLVGSLFEGLNEDCATSVDPPEDGVPTAVVLYDLIPFLHPQRYLAQSGVNTWYRRKIDSLQRADLLLGISESACDEARTALQLPTATRVLNISSAADPGIFHPGPVDDVAKRLGIRDRFVLYTGGVDWRKNVEGLLRAWALLPAEERASRQLVVVFHAGHFARGKLLALAHDLGLGRDEVAFTGYVSDEDLAALYRACELFVFPSLHEGFGLPALEAMMCGAPVIGSDATSIPEVIGRSDALFDPRSDREMADLMSKALRDRAFSDSLRQHASTQAARFSWEHSAQVALAALEQLANDSAGKFVTPPVARPARPRLAMVAPLRPARTGIADYTSDLLPVLREHYDIELVTEQQEVDLPAAVADLPVRTPAWFDEHAGEFDRIVYQFGNSIFHAFMLDLLREHPGVVVLHDFFLSGMFSWAPGAFEEALFRSHGPQALADERANGRDAAVLKYPVNRGVLQRATGVIVHSRWSMAAAGTWYGEGYSREWRHIPHLRHLPRKVERAKARSELGIAPDEVLVCSFGHLGATKLNVQALEAWNASSLARDLQCRFVLVGGGKPPYLDDARNAMRNSDRISITGYAERDLYERYLCAADFAVQLRAQSRGETSGAVLDCLAHGVPVIANANGSNAEYPPEVVRLLPDEFREVELVAALEELRRDSTQCARRSAAGRDWIRKEHDPVTIAARYRDAIESFAQNPQHLDYWDAVNAIAALEAAPSEADLAAAAVALAATVSPGSDRARGTTAPSAGR
jgi:glycosyltransferase involved in cell wall biosynthesis